MNLQEKKVVINIDDPKQLYDWRLSNCVLYMKNNGYRNVFEKYFTYYNLEPTAELSVRFRYFWRGSVKDEPTLLKYETLIKSLENENQNRSRNSIKR